MTQPNILIVDDKKENLLAVEAILESPHYRIFKADSGEEALKQVLTNDFALILLDVQMPTLDGFETARAIKARQKSREIPIIFMTAVNREERFIHAGYEVGAVDYIFKPINAHVLQSKVAVFIDLFLSKEALREAHDELELKVEARTRDLEIARSRAEAEERRSSFLAEASQILSESLDYERTLKSLASLIVPSLADWCTVDILNERQVLTRVAFSHIDPSTHEYLQSLRVTERQKPLTIGPMHVFSSGRSEMCDIVTEAQLRELAEDPGHHDLLVELGMKSYMCVPLVARGRTLGIITFAIGTSERKYEASDLRFAELLAARAAVLIDNARLYKEAQDANVIKDEFLATVSHELRTPLTSILGWARMLRSGKINSETAEKALESIERNARNQAQLVDDLLDVSRIITGKFILDVGSVGILSIVQACIDSMKPAADEKQVRLESDLPEKLGFVSGDPTRLQQVILNLLSNAVKFTEPGGLVRVSLETVGTFVKISVLDTGKGIDPEFLPHVFERFRQADSTTTRVHGGLGLGLAIVRHIVEVHGGSISADSKGLGEGSTFTVLLPLLPIEEQEVPEKKEAPSLSIRGIKVLVVDDNDDTREMLCVTLREKEAEVRTTASFTEAFELLEQWKPDVLLSDIAMPGKDGYLLVQNLRSIEKDKNVFTPAIAVTAYAGAEDRKRALSAGFQSHIAKPVDTSELILMIRSLTGKSWKESQYY